MNPSILNPMRRLSRLAGALLIAASVACGSRRAAPVDAQIFPGPPDAPLADAAPADAALDHDNSFGEAIPITIGPPGIQGSFEIAGDRDYYSFTAAAGDWLSFSTVTNDPTYQLSAGIVLYDASMTQVAQATDFLSEFLITRIAVSGTYYLLIEDANLLHGLPPVTGVQTGYELDTWRLDATSGVTFETEAGDDAASAQVTFFRSLLLGRFRDAADVDVFSVTIPSAAVVDFEVIPTPAGPMGDGATATYGHLTVTDATGATVLARTSSLAGGGLADAHPSVPLPTPATYLLWIDHGAAPAGADDFYEVSTQAYTEDGVEKEPSDMTGANDTLAAAEASGEHVGLWNPPGYYATHLLAFLPPGDVDYLGLDVPQAGMLHVMCSAAMYGSGLVGLHTELRDETDALLAEADDPDPVPPTPVLAHARYWIRLTATGQDPVVTSDFVRCHITY